MHDERDVQQPDTAQPEQRSRPDWFLPDADWRLVKFIVAQLDETDLERRKKITAIVRICGPDFAYSIFEQTIDLENNSDETVADGSRSNTFFQLAREQMPPDTEQKIFAKKRRKSSPAIQAAKIAQAIAEQLGETEDEPVKQLHDIARVCGTVFAQNILEQTAEIEANGGLLIGTGIRRRTPGGVYFFLARQQMSYQQRARVFPRFGQKPQQPKPQRETKPPPPPPAAPFVWEERFSIVEDLQEARGIARTAKVILVGRPDSVEQYDGFIAMTISSAPVTKSLPNGVPRVAEVPDNYIVLMATKQQDKIKMVMADPDDLLIIEGVCVCNWETGEVTVYATNVTTKNLDMQKRARGKE